MKLRLPADSAQAFQVLRKHSLATLALQELKRRTTLSHGLDTIPLSTQEHEAIAEAVAARNEARAQSLLTKHVLASRERLQSAVQTSTRKTA